MWIYNGYEIGDLLYQRSIKLLVISRYVKRRKYTTIRAASMETSNEHLEEKDDVGQTSKKIKRMDQKRI